MGTSDVLRTLGNAGGSGAAETNPSFLSRFASGECTYRDVIVNVTTLGSGAGGAKRSVGNIVNYLEGKSPPTDRQLDRPGSVAQTLKPDQHAVPGRYYADSGDGRWIGRGTEGAGFALEGAVERDHVKNMLLGADPNTGQPLMHSRGVSKRANNGQGALRDASIDAPHPQAVSVSPVHSAEGALPDPADSGQGALPNALPGPPVTVSSAAFAAEHGLDDSYIRRVIRNTNKHLETQDQARAEGLPVPAMPATHLYATKHGKTWFIDRAESARFLDARKPQQVVHGYDLTFSVPKSVSVLWAAATPEVQDTIEASHSRAVEAGMAYIEDEGFWIRSGRGAEPVRDMTAAAYRHHTSRATRTTA